MAEQRALESEFQSRVLFVFTIVTVIFVGILFPGRFRLTLSQTPISFICSLYAIPSQEFPQRGGSTSWSISRIGTAMGSCSPSGLTRLTWHRRLRGYHPAAHPVVLGLDQARAGDGEALARVAAARVRGRGHEQDGRRVEGPDADEHGGHDPDDTDVVRAERAAGEQSQVPAGRGEAKWDGAFGCVEWCLKTTLDLN
jgi:hypothetical protein